jgi:hypothetical protein
MNRVQHEMRRGVATKPSLYSVVATRVSCALGPTFGTAFIIAVLYALVAAAAFNGYYVKWTMHDGHDGQSLVAMLDGTAQRPYVYRQLLPKMAETIEQVMPAPMRDYLELRFRTGDRALKQPSGPEAGKPGYVVRYRIAYYLTFLSLFLGLIALRSVCLVVGMQSPAATAAPAMFALMIPVLQTRGGYFYDLPEVLAFALAARLALGGHILGLLLLAVPATLNKEVFFFYSLALLPLLRERLSLRNAVAAALGAVFVSGVTYLVLRFVYAGNDGQNAIFQLWNNVLFYANPLNLLVLDQSYGLPLFRGYGIIVFAWFAIFMTYGWREVPHRVRSHLRLAAVINVPLLLLFCAGGEVRNLSMLYVPIVILMAAALQRWLRSPALAASTSTK